jgi:hypothetical protein
MELFILARQLYLAECGRIGVRQTDGTLSYESCLIIARDIIEVEKKSTEIFAERDYQVRRGNYAHEQACIAEKAAVDKKGAYDARFKEASAEYTE